MKTVRVIFYFLNMALFLILTSCAKEDEDQPNFVGEWYAERERIQYINGVPQDWGTWKDTVSMKINRDESGSVNNTKGGYAEIQWDLLEEENSIVLTSQSFVDTTEYYRSRLYEIILDEPNKQIWEREHFSFLSEYWEHSSSRKITMTRIK